ncbi:hypothetical protein [Agilicoccus flavus]|uniref:hypothetical protein n=1 Tax=Agilicoccus flavus TaxID=2775968 RepID=UPI001CF66F90|nr:hypothetical protein [Agilicoccus flavus]
MSPVRVTRPAALSSPTPASADCTFGPWDGPPVTAAPLLRLAEAGTRVVAFCAGPHRRLLLWTGVAWGILTYVAFAVDSDGLGGLLFLVTSVVLITIMSLGPVLLGARPRRIWLVETLAGTLLLLSLLGQVVPWSIGPLRFVDVTFFAAYVALVLWLTLLSRHVGGGERLRRRR